VCHHHRVDRGRERAAARGDGAKVREAAGVRVAHVHTAVEKNRKLPRSVSHRHQHGRPAHLAAGAQGADAQDAHWDGGARGAGLAGRGVRPRHCPAPPTGAAGLAGMEAPTPDLALAAVLAAVAAAPGAAPAARRASGSRTRAPPR